MKKFLSYIGLTLLAVILLDVLYGLAMEHLSGDRNIEAVDHITEATEDIAIIGSSRASHHYDPQLLSKGLNMTAYNYGIEGLNIFADKAILATLLTKAERRPALVILDLSESDVCDVPGWNADHLSLLYPYVELPTVDSVLAEVTDPRELFFVRYSKLYRYNSRILDYLKPAPSAGQRQGNGYLPLQGRWSEAPKEEKSAYAVSPQKMDFLEQFIRLCNDNGVVLVLATSPNYKRLPKEQPWVTAIKKMAQQHQIPYLYHEQDAEFLAHAEWFNEPYHLNAEGAAAYTRKIIPELPRPFRH